MADKVAIVVFCPLWLRGMLCCERTFAGAGGGSRNAGDTQWEVHWSCLRVRARFWPRTRGNLFPFLVTPIKGASAAGWFAICLSSSTSSGSSARRDTQQLPGQLAESMQEASSLQSLPVCFLLAGSLRSSVLFVSSSHTILKLSRQGGLLGLHQPFRCLLSCNESKSCKNRPLGCGCWPTLFLSRSVGVSPRALRYRQSYL